MTDSAQQMQPANQHPPRSADSATPFARMTEIQKPLMARYRVDPRGAWVTDHAETSSRRDPRDPMRGKVILGPAREAELDIALHSAVGGDSALPVPGDLLAAALATCLDSTLRVIASRFEIELTDLKVSVDAEVDVRGTLMVDPHVPIGFQRMGVRIHMRAAPGTHQRKLDMLPRVAEQCCVVLQTLRGGVDVNLSVDAREASH